MWSMRSKVVVQGLCWHKGLFGARGFVGFVLYSTDVSYIKGHSRFERILVVLPWSTRLWWTTAFSTHESSPVLSRPLAAKTSLLSWMIQFMRWHVQLQLFHFALSLLLMRFQAYVICEQTPSYHSTSKWLMHITHVVSFTIDKPRCAASALYIATDRIFKRISQRSQSFHSKVDIRTRTCV